MGNTCLRYPAIGTGARVTQASVTHVPGLKCYLSPRPFRRSLWSEELLHSQPQQHSNAHEDRTTYQRDTCPNEPWVGARRCGVVGKHLGRSERCISQEHGKTESRTHGSKYEAGPLRPPRDLAEPLIDMSDGTSLNKDDLAIAAHDAKAAVDRGHHQGQAPSGCRYETNNCPALFDSIGTARLHLRVFSRGLTDRA